MRRVPVAMVAAGGMTAAAGLALALLSGLPIGLLVAALGLMLAFLGWSTARKRRADGDATRVQSPARSNVAFALLMLSAVVAAAVMVLAIVSVL